MSFNYGKIFIIGLGSFGFSLLWIVYNAFVPLFLSNRFGLPPALIGFFMTLDNLAALLIQPPVGAYSDRLRTRIGRRLPFILAGVPVAALAFGLIPSAAALPLFAACTVSFMLTMALWRTPVVALMSDITPSRFRSQANGITSFMGGLGAIIGTLGGGALFARNQALPFWMGSGLVLLAALLLLMCVREPREFASTSDEQPSLWGSLQDILRNPDKSALRLMLAILASYLTTNAIEAFFTLYAQNHLELAGAEGASLLGHFVITLVLFSLPAGSVGARAGRRNTIVGGLVVLGACLLAIYVLPAPQLATALLQAPVLGTLRGVSLPLLLCGAAWAMVNVNVLPMVVDMTDDLRVGTYTGLYYIFYTLAAILGPNLNGWIVQLANGNYNLMPLTSALFCLIAIGLMWGVRRGEAKAGSVG
jgi:Na+/melibiose symporter-like transporter